MDCGISLAQALIFIFFAFLGGFIISAVLAMGSDDERQG